MNDTPLKLYYSPGACSLAVHIVLEEVGRPFELELVSIREGANLRPEYAAIHPLQRVPALATSDGILTEASAILLHLADLHPELKLAPPPGTALRARAYELCAFLASSVHIAFGQVWRAARFASDESMHAAIQARGREWVTTFYGMIDARLKETTYALGDAYSVCDPYLLVFYRWGNRISLPMTRYEAWTRHAERLLARPAVERAFAREGITIAT